MPLRAAVRGELQPLTAGLDHVDAVDAGERHRPVERARPQERPRAPRVDLKLSGLARAQPDLAEPVAQVRARGQLAEPQLLGGLLKLRDVRPGQPPVQRE